MANIFSTPRVPDPYQVAGAQTQVNQQTAAYNNAQSHGNTTTPLGSQTYTSRIDPVTGATVYDSNVSLTPDQQQLLTLQNQQDLSLGNTATGLLGNINSTYSTPMDYSGLPGLYGSDDLLGARTQTQDALYGKQTSYLDPQFDARAKALETRLANQGIGLGSEAWKNAQDDFSRDRAFNYDQARTSAIAGGSSEMNTLSGIASKNRAQMLSEALTKRNQPLNEFNALRDTTKVNMPSFDGASGGANSSTTPANLTGSVYDAYNAQAGNAAQNQERLMGLINTGVDAAGGPEKVWDSIKGMFVDSPNTLPANTQNSSLPQSQQGPTNANAGNPSSASSFGSAAAAPAAAAAYQAATAGAAPVGSVLVSDASGILAGGGAPAAATGAGLLADGGATLAPHTIFGAAANGAIGGGTAASTSGAAAGMNLATLGPIGGAILAAFALKKISDVDRSRASGTTDPYAGLFTDMGYGGLQGNDPQNPEWQSTVAGVDPNSGIKWEEVGGKTTWTLPNGQSYITRVGPDGQPYLVDG